MTDLVVDERGSLMPLPVVVMCVQKPSELSINAAACLRSHHHRIAHTEPIAEADSVSRVLEEGERVPIGSANAPVGLENTLRHLPTPLSIHDVSCIVSKGPDRLSTRRRVRVLRADLPRHRLSEIHPRPVGLPAVGPCGGGARTGICPAASLSA